MSYSTHPTKFVSHLLKKEYPFNPKGKHGRADKQRAMNELLADHRAIEQAAEARHGRQLSLRELRDGPIEPDYRSVREQAADGEVQHTAQPISDPDHNNFSARIVQLETKLRHETRPSERSKLQRRIDVLMEASNKFDTDLSERRAHEQLLASLPVQKAIAEAQSELERLAMDQTTPAAFIAEAKMRLASLQESGDVSAYRAAKADSDTAIGEYRAAQHAAFEEEIARLRAEAGIGEGTNGLVESTALGASEIEA